MRFRILALAAALVGCGEVASGHPACRPAPVAHDYLSRQQSQPERSCSPRGEFECAGLGPHVESETCDWQRSTVCWAGSVVVTREIRGRWEGEAFEETTEVTTTDSGAEVCTETVVMRWEP